MKAQELRIGNLLKKDGVVVTIDGRSIFDIWSSEASTVLNHAYEAIPLTPEILERLGFEQFSPGLYHVKIHPDQERFLETILPSKDFWDMIITVHKRHYEDVELWIRSVKFVHQLQNLYWCLCGEELTLKTGSAPTLH